MVKKYIDLNANKRKYACNSFEKDFFKLMNNSTFGRTMKNERKVINFRLVINAEDYKEYVSKPPFVSTFVAIHEIKSVLTHHSTNFCKI